jgi:hypothetical protein
MQIIATLLNTTLWSPVSQILTFDRATSLSFFNSNFSYRAFAFLNSTAQILAGVNNNEITAFPDASLEAIKRHMLYARTPHGTDELRRRVHIAHGVLATTTIVVFFPSVAIILRVISSPNIVRLHWMLQLCNVGILLVAFGLGCWLSWLDGWVMLHLVSCNLTLTLSSFGIGHIR